MSGNIFDFLNSLSFSTWKHPTEFFNLISELLNSQNIMPKQCHTTMKPQETIFLSPAWLEPHSLKFLNRPKYSKANFAAFCFDGIIFCGIYIIL